MKADPLDAGELAQAHAHLGHSLAILEENGNAIPLSGRIAGLVDTSGGLFQDELIERFIRVVGIFPIASLVELDTGEVGIVVEQNSLGRLHPKVMLILDGREAHALRQLAAAVARRAR